MATNIDQSIKIIMILVTIMICYVLFINISNQMIINSESRTKKFREKYKVIVN